MKNSTILAVGIAIALAFFFGYIFGHASTEREIQGLTAEVKLYKAERDMHRDATNLLEQCIMLDSGDPAERAKGYQLVQAFDNKYRNGSERKP